MRRPSHRVAAGLPVLAALALLPTACTKTGFMSFVKQDAEEAPPSQLPPLSLEQLLDQLKGLDLRVGELDGAESSAKPFMLCEAEEAQEDAVKLDGDELRVRYRAAADACPAAWYKEAPGQVQHGTGLATYDYQLSCPGGDPARASGLRAGDFFAYQTFHASGPAESACLDKGGGKARFKLSAVRSYGMDVIDRQDDTRRATMSYKTTFTASREGGAPCEAVRGSDGAVTIADCTYTRRLEQDDTYTFKASERLAVLLTARLRQAVAKPGVRFYASGTMDLDVNGWRGTVQLAGAAPEATLSNGQDSVRVRINGAFTERLH
jgi:hypothetical protein